jgi:hypothetical protein
VDSVERNALTQEAAKTIKLVAEEKALFALEWLAKHRDAEYRKIARS